MKRIKLTRGYYACVDNEDYTRVIAEGSWYARVDRHKDGTKKNIYAIRTSRSQGKQSTLFMHCFILGCLGIDHRDHDGLNNQKHNLRTASNSQNQENKKKPRNCTSKYKGVCWHKGCGKWAVQIGRKASNRHLGYFSSEIKAALAYDEAAIVLYGEFANLNFPRKHHDQ